MSKLVEVLVKRRKIQEKYFKDYLKYAKIIKKRSQEILKDKVKVFVFGSILKKNETPADIDILVISSKLDKTDKKSKARAKIWEKIGLSTLF